MLKNEFISIVNKCQELQKIRFKKGDIVTNYVQNRNRIWILIEGYADLLRYDLNGNKIIVQRLTKNDIFGEIFHPILIDNEMFVLAKSNCLMVTIDYEKIIHKCKDICPVHQELRNKIMAAILNYTNTQNVRIELLIKRTIREKILAYFYFASSNLTNKKFIIPFSYTDLADYLNIDRSAMSREIKSLVDDKFIKKNGKEITLLY